MGLGGMIGGFFGSAAVDLITGGDDDDKQQGYAAPRIVDKYSTAIGAMTAARSSVKAGSQVAQYSPTGTTKMQPSKAMADINNLKKEILQKKKNAAALIGATKVDLVSSQYIEEGEGEKTNQKQIALTGTPDPNFLEYNVDI